MPSSAPVLGFVAVLLFVGRSQLRSGHSADDCTFGLTNIQVALLEGGWGQDFRRLLPAKSPI